MKRKVCFVLTLCLMFLLSPLCAAQSDAAKDYLDSVESELSSVIDRDVMDTIEGFGISDLKNVQGFGGSLRGLGDFFAGSLKDSLSDVRHWFCRLLALILFLACLQTLLQTQNPMLQTAALCVAVLQSIQALQSVLAAAASLLHASALFMKGYLPIYAGIVAFSGAPVSAVAYQSFLFAFAQTEAALADTVCIRAVGAFLCLSIAFSISGRVRMPAFLNAANRTMTLLLGFGAAAFTGALSVKGLLSASADAASAKSVRFLISSLIPVVGASISDAYSSILGSIHLMKGSVAIVGMLVLLVLHLPVIAQSLLTYLSFWALGALSETMEQPKLGSFFRACSLAIKFTLLLAILELFFLLIATGLMLQVKGGG